MLGLGKLKEAAVHALQLILDELNFSADSTQQQGLVDKHNGEADQPTRSEAMEPWVFIFDNTDP